MGYMKHHAIVVTSFNGHLLDEAREKAADIFNEGRVSEIVNSDVNGYKSFFIGPDGSKESREESDDNNLYRERFLKWVREQEYEDGSSPFDCCEIMYGGDDGSTGMISNMTFEVPKVKSDFLSDKNEFKVMEREIKYESEDKGDAELIPIKRGCNSAKNGGCMCLGTCEEIVGYRRKHPFEK